MYNLFISIGAAILIFLAFFFPLHLPWYSSIVPAVIALLGIYILLARRTMKQVEAVVLAAQKDIVNKRLDAGIAKMKDAFAFGPWQFLVKSQVNSQLGAVLYMMKRFGEARPYLEKSFLRMGQPRAMLGALHYMDKKYDEMTKVFEEAVSYNKKDGFVWSVYAWCLNSAGQRDKALEVINRGLVESPSDEKMKANQLALQNKERLRMKAYGQEWWAFYLESPPADFVPPHMRGQLLQQRKGYRTPRQRT